MNSYLIALSLACLLPVSSSAGQDSLQGRLAYVRSGSIMVYDFQDSKEKTIAVGTNYARPLWSPDGNHILAKAGGKLVVLDLNGKEVVSLPDIPITAVVHWLSKDSFVVLLNEPYKLPTIGGIRQTDLNSEAQPSSYYSVYQLGTDLKELEWRVLYGGSSSRDTNLTTKADAAHAIRSNSHIDIACTLDSKDCVIRSAYPYMLPVKTQAGMRFVLAASMREGKNFFIGYNTNAVQRVLGDNLNDEMFMLIPESMLVDPNSGYFPAWSPNGKQIAYSSWQSSSDGIFILQSKAKKLNEGELVLQRTSSRKDIKGYFLESYSHPRWSPDGRYLISTHRKPKSINPLSQKTELYINLYDTQTKKSTDLFLGKDPDWISQNN